MKKSAIVVVLGASPKVDRYSNRAQAMLGEAGYTVVPVAPNYSMIDGLQCLPSLLDFEGEVDTVTVYLSPRRLAGVVDEIVKKKPRRVIFNPGAESEDVYPVLRDAGIECQEACTLVLLRTGQF